MIAYFYFKTYQHYRSPISRVGKKIIQKINAKILGKLFFSKKYFLCGEKKNLVKYS
jgi:hypothetical protein